MLRYDYSRCCEDAKSDENCCLRDALIYTTLSVGMGEITEKNYKRFAARCRLYETLFGTLMHFLKKPVFITLADVKMFIGLKTNVGYETDAQWGKRVLGRYSEEYLRSDGQPM